MENIIALLLTILMACGIIIGIFLACRELVCWYAKTNERLELEKRRNAQLEEISTHLKTLIQIELAKKKEREEENSFALQAE